MQIWPADLPKHGAYAELRRLARILQVPLADITSQLKKSRADPVAFPQGRRNGAVGLRMRLRQ